MNLEDTLIATEDICRQFAEGDAESKASLRKQLLKGEGILDNLISLIQYYFAHVWNDCEIPEQISTSHHLRPLWGAEDAVEALEVGKEEILKMCFPNYGLLYHDDALDEEKCKVIINTKKKGLHQRMKPAFFSGQHAFDNIRQLTNYTWKNYWSKKYEIPEQVRERDLQPIFPDTAYVVVTGKGFHDNLSFLRKLIPGYGDFDVQKCGVYVAAGKLERAFIAPIFCRGDRGFRNARFWAQYFLKNAVKKPFPELILRDEVSHYGGLPFFELFGSTCATDFLPKVYADYGLLSDEKATHFIDIYKSDKSVQGSHTSNKLRRIFFGDNPLREENERTYVEAYQRVHRKKYRDLTIDDFAQMPPEIRDLTPASTHLEEDREGVQYHSIHIRWTTHLEERLRELFRECGDTLFTERQLLWDQLGVTPFAAYMKAADLGLVKDVQFGQGERLKSTPVYNIVTFPGYNTPGLILEQEESLRTQPKTELDIEGFSTPITRAGFHVQLPVEYKGVSLAEYSPREQELLKLTATYLRRPDDFLEDGQVMHYASHEEMDNPHCLVPIDVNGKLLTKIYLPRIFAQDPGAVYSCVFETSFGRVNFLYQTMKGEVQNSLAATPLHKLRLAS